MKSLLMSLKYPEEDEQVAETLWERCCKENQLLINK